MSKLTDYVGRLARLCSIVSKPELNDSYVLVLSYLPDRNRFTVRTIPIRGSTDGAALTLAVKLECLMFLPQSSFSDKYPHSTELCVVNFETQMNQCKNGMVLNLSSLQRTEKPVRLHFALSHRVLGKKAALDGDGIPHPTTTLVGDVYISATDEENIIEFEDIRFVGSPNQVICTRGKNITFRRCSFHNSWVSVGTGNSPFFANNPVIQQRLVEYRSNNIGKPNVVFENCFFEAEDTICHQSFGVNATCDGTVALLNCVVRKCSTGAVVGPGGQILLSRCTIENCNYGVAASGRVQSLRMASCVVANMDKLGLDLDMTGHVSIDGCRIEDCGDVGINIRGTSKHTCHVNVSNCYIAKIGDGLSLEMGKFSAHISSNIFLYHVRCAMFLHPSVVGKVEISQCRFSECGLGAVGNNSGTECQLTIDGVPQEPQIQQFDASGSLRVRRCFQRAGFIHIVCSGCGKEEAVEKFKKCGKCNEVVYCSRECQAAHWKEHKKECGKEENG